MPVIRCEPGEALAVLFDLGERPNADDSLRFLGRIADLALELVASGRVLPGLLNGHEGPTASPAAARWMPAPTPEQADRLQALLDAMPPLCRAESIDGSGGGRHPGEVVGDMLLALTDEVARSALCGRLPLPPRRGRPPRTVPPPERFVLALAEEPPRATMSGDPNELAALGKAVDGWHRSGLRAAGPIRTCFRLVPPDGRDQPEQDEPWRVEFLLQSTEDPSLLVPAERVWRAGRRLPAFGGTVEEPQERLLEDLGRAVRLWPDLDGALNEPQPTAVSLDPAGAHRFLRETAPLLEQAGLGVMVPPWWGSGLRLGVRLRARSASAPRTAGPGRFGLDEVVDYRYEVALGDETLSPEELHELAALKVPLVRMRGGWVELRAEDVEAALRILERDGLPNAEMTVAEVLRAGLGLAPTPAGLPIVAVEAEGWLGDLLSGDRRFEPLPAPPTFDGRLRPYQERGLGWLAFLDALGLGACLADDMGLGKTIQLLALLLQERSANGRPRRRLPPTLLVCPMSVVGNWQREAQRFAPTLAVHVHHGADRRAGSAFAKAARRADLVVTTYALAARDLDVLARVEWGRIVLDEAQNIKNPQAKQTQAMRSLNAARKVALTGTPVENRLTDLWSIMEFLNPGLLGSAKGFRERFAVPIERYRDEEAAGRLKRITGPFVLRRLKTDRTIICDLPDKLEMKVFCNLTREQATLYQAVVEDMLARVEESEGIERRGLVLATILKLKQVCNHPAQLLADRSRIEGRSGKLARLEEILEEVLAEGDRALCFTQFAVMGRLLQEHLERRFTIEVPFLHGGVPKGARDEMVARFQEAGGPPVLLLSVKAGGVGLNLTAANHVIHFDRWWNPAVEDQATDRAFRIGQRRNVQVRKFVCVGTLEERIDRMIEEKRDLAQRIVGTGEAWLTELSTADLRQLVALSADAVAEG